MSRFRVIAVAAVLIATGWSLWIILWPGGNSSKPPPSIGDMIHRAKAASGAPSPLVRKTTAGDSFTFQHEGTTVTVDLAKVRRSHALLIRQEATPPNGTVISTPDPDFDFLSWPRRTLTGLETIKTQRCWVIDFTNPETTGDATYGTVRLFVRKEDSMLMRTQAYNPAGKLDFALTTTRFRRVDGTVVVAGATASHYQPGTMKLVADVEYLAPR